MWALVVVLSVAIIAARHHYTVDVVVAWYVVPLVWNYYLHWQPDGPFPTLPEDKFLISNIELESICIADDGRDVKSYRSKRTLTSSVSRQSNGNAKKTFINGASRMFAGASKHFNGSMPFSVAGVSSPRGSLKVDDRE